MQSTNVGDGSGEDGGGGGEMSRSGLSRIRSAPATWIETLLEEEEEDEGDGLKPNLCLTELLTGNNNNSGVITSRDSFEFPSSVEQGLYSTTHQGGGFHRQNSSPADFLSGSCAGTDGFFSNFGIPASYDYLSPNVDISPTKRSRDMEEAHFSSQMKEEQMSGGISGMMDMNMDKLLEDSVPCRVRAKRGCATHPRSIAERVRRTRISDRIRRLQELVPNMDKQTNTADMLEEAVEYVKTLQSQIQELTEQQKRCICKPKEEQ
ncbi:PREDICTED: transcription factor bHLH80 [Camelina sativa]|uniref:Transcription factor bHLH80 n=1 Tax=Camelina sativa TaxID=90675 RepID=A0ABM0X0S2_CAMSA|nr:PREDICTED: transcription factor bHLH80 [Camelina sativa]